LLTSYGVAVPKAAEPCLAKDASNVAAEIGFPVVLKGTGFAHKTEAGAVRLNLTSTEDVEAAARSMPSDTMLVEEMITGTVAELLIGVVCDPAHGYVLTLAAGGTLTELMEDSASLLVPTQREDVEAALRSLKVMALLSGYRGAPAADVNAVLDVVMAVQTLVTATKPQEIEINPLMCGTTRAVAADALIRTGDQDDR
ncbi:MAG: acetate--CoA ligase family protein, partial [Pseudomonadota bacterium]